MRRISKGGFVWLVVGLAVVCGGCLPNGDKGEERTEASREEGDVTARIVPAPAPQLVKIGDVQLEFDLVAFDTGITRVVGQTNLPAGTVLDVNVIEDFDVGRFRESRVVVDESGKFLSDDFQFESDEPVGNFLVNVRVSARGLQKPHVIESIDKFAEGRFVSVSGRYIEIARSGVFNLGGQAGIDRQQEIRSAILKTYADVLLRVRLEIEESNRIRFDHEDGRMVAVRSGMLSEIDEKLEQLLPKFTNHELRWRVSELLSSLFTHWTGTDDENLQKKREYEEFLMKNLRDAELLVSEAINNGDQSEPRRRSPKVIRELSLSFDRYTERNTFTFNQ